MLDLNKLVEQVKAVVVEAAKFTQVTEFSVCEKEGESYNIVTSADVAVQEFLQERLPSLVPGSSFQGEEEGWQHGKGEMRWIVDPIDGTANFSRGMRQSGISVAFRTNDGLVLGVVYNPDLKDLFWAIKGGGAYLNGERISVSKKDFEHSILCTALCLYRKNYSKICSDVLFDAYQKCADFRRFGAASLELCYLAAGRVDTYFEIRLFPWDFAAATVILREAGGVIGTLDWSELDADNSGGARDFSSGSGSIRLTTDLVLDGPSTVIAANCCENFHKIGQIVINHMEYFDPKEYN